jgi:hypothetical protein
MAASMIAIVRATLACRVWLFSYLRCPNATLEAAKALFRKAMKNQGSSPHTPNYTVRARISDEEVS